MVFAMLLHGFRLLAAWRGGWIVLSVVLGAVQLHWAAHVTHCAVGCADEDCSSYIMFSSFYLTTELAALSLASLPLSLVLFGGHILHYLLLDLDETRPHLFGATDKRRSGLISLVIVYIAIVQLLRVMQGRFQSLRRVFGRYVSDSIVDELLSNPDETLKIGGKRRYLTVLMSDLRGFSNMIASLAPEESLGLMNAYLADMLQIVTEHGGTVDEIIGDAILAVFGLETGGGGDERDAAAARDAVRCAAAMQQAMTRHPRLSMGIAVHSGELVVGNIGSTIRAKFGMIGAPINMAARIESYSLGGQVLVSGEVIEAVSGGGGDSNSSFDWVLRDRRTVHPKGAPPDGLVIAVVERVAGVLLMDATEARESLRPIAPPVAATIAALSGPGKGAQNGRPCQLVQLSGAKHVVVRVPNEPPSFFKRDDNYQIVWETGEMFVKLTRSVEEARQNEHDVVLSISFIDPESLKQLNN